MIDRCDGSAFTGMLELLDRSPTLLPPPCLHRHRLHGVLASQRNPPLADDADGPDRPEQLCRTLTWDQGKEMVYHVQFSVETAITVYYGEPPSP